MIRHARGTLPRIRCAIPEWSPVIRAGTRQFLGRRPSRACHGHLRGQAEVSQDSLHDRRLLSQGHESQPAPQRGHARTSSPNVRRISSAPSRRWEATPATLHYTPNRWLVLVVTFVVSARVLYGLWRSWMVARVGVSGTPVMMAFGIPESLAAGGTVIGYYIAYGLGVRRRIFKWQNRVLRVT